MHIKNYLLLLLLIPAHFVMAQVTVSGTILDTQNKTLAGASIELKAIKVTTTDANGTFSLSNIPAGTHSLVIRYLGYKSQEHQVEINNKDLELNYTLSADPLELDGVIVTGTFAPQTKLNASVAITTLRQKDFNQRQAKGTADLLRAIPGTQVDASTGEVFTRVYSRGISASAEDDHGWFYVSLQEDGLPVSAVQYKFFSADFFHRNDLTTSKLEAIRGGASAISSPNTPGGVYNFISKEGQNAYGGELQLTGALQGDGNPLFRVDANVGGPISKAGFRYNIGGFYRYDRGPRETDYSWGKGGQFKFNLIKDFKKGYAKVYAKYLNDKVNRYPGLPATNWDDPQPAFGVDFNTGVQMFPSLETEIADGRNFFNDPTATRTFKPENGIHTKDFAAGLDIAHDIHPNWRIRNNFKFTTKTANWQSSIGNQPISLSNPFAYCLSGANCFFDPTNPPVDVPFGQIVFRDAQTNQTLAIFDNAVSNSYIEGSLPNDAIMGIAPWQKDDEVTEFMDQLTIDFKNKSHQFTAGAFFARSDVETYTTGSFAYATYEPNPRMLSVTVENPGAPVVELSDAAGISNYGGLFYENGNAVVTNLSAFIHENWKINSQWNVSVGLRYEHIQHDGQKDQFFPVGFAVPGGPDGMLETAYDNSTNIASGEIDVFDFSYDNVSFSLGTNYSINEQMAVFARYTYGNKAPEVSYYFNSSSPLGITPNEKGVTQKIQQAELGYKLSTNPINIFATAYWSRLGDISFSEFDFDFDSGSVFFTPIQSNTTTAYGLELEGVLSIAKGLKLNFVSTFQITNADQFTVYDSKGTTDLTDDEVIDYSGNELPFNPKFSIELTPSYSYKFLSAFFNWRFLGERQANINNAFQLPAFSLFNTGISANITEHFSVRLVVNNLFNSTGLMNFFGPNEFGSNASAATAKYIADNPNAGFVVFPVMPRSFIIQAGYRF